MKYSTYNQSAFLQKDRQTTIHVASLSLTELLKFNVLPIVLTCYGAIAIVLVSIY